MGGIWTDRFLALDRDQCHVRWVPCNHGMAHPQVADGGDALQFWRAAANILTSSRGQPTRVVLQLGGWAWG
jgi:hypothetical protein